jgi:hypothetical protein
VDVRSENAKLQEGRGQRRKNGREAERRNEERRKTEKLRKEESRKWRTKIKKEDISMREGKEENMKEGKEETKYERKGQDIRKMRKVMKMGMAVTDSVFTPPAQPSQRRMSAIRSPAPVH